MVAAFLQRDLIKELKEIFKDFKLLDPHGKRSEIHFFEQNLPMPEAREPQDIPPELLENGLAEEITKEDPYPYIIVKVDGGIIEDPSSAQTVNTELLIGVYDEGYAKQGFKDVMNIIQKIYERFAKDPILSGKYRIAYPIEWALQEEESYPYYFGGMALTWEMAAIRREDYYS